MFRNNVRYNRNYSNNNRIPRRRVNFNRNIKRGDQPKLILRKLPAGLINTIVRQNPVPNYRRKKRNNMYRNKNNNRELKIIKEVKDFLVPKVTNINRVKRKEPRRDLIITPMQMALESRMMSIYPTPNRITYMSIYTKFNVDTVKDKNSYVMWFPYCVPFNNYNNKNIEVNSNNGATLANTMSNVVRIVEGETVGVSTASIFKCGVCGILGMYRLVGATMKVTNLSALTNKSGSYSVYRLTESSGHPAYYDTDHKPTKDNAPNYFQEIYSICRENHDQIAVKQTYASNDICHINEFNLTQGNTIFSKADEYIGSSFQSSNECCAVWNQNPDGVNIKYLTQIPGTSNINNYLFETWAIIELIPDPSTHLDSLAKLQTKDTLMSKKRVEAMKHMNPLSKS